ncbi:hypothetical protein [Rubrivivax gelatinosus]|uniref:hypothetical protein n=1 Tax=Rubrivivax gelatinosus TaxID=28068 RepID=UPI001E3F9381|nr:hypothetical protein [Rubrivivax gelatinosus]
MPRKLVSLLVLALACGGAAAGDCTLVFGQGRGVAAADAAEVERWDGVNFAFNRRVAEVLGERGEAVVPLVARAADDDVPATVRAVLSRAAADGCARIVETTLFADAEAGVLVARLREYPLAHDAAGALRIQPPRLTVERQFDLSPTTLDRVRPAVLGATMAAELAEQRAAAAGR